MRKLKIKPIDNTDDQQLIQDLYTQYMPWIKKRAHKIVGDFSACEDLAHDCILNMIKYIDTIRSLPADKQRAYIAVMIDNLSKNYVKSASKSITMAEITAAELGLIADEDNDVESIVEKKFRYETMYSCFDELLDRDKGIIQMKFDLDLEEQEIADSLQIKKDSVRMTVRRSMNKLKNKMIKREEE